MPPANPEDRADPRKVIRAVVFDFGNVLCSFNVRLLAENLASASGLPLERIREGLLECRDIAELYETGLITTEVFLQGVVERTGVSLGSEHLRQAYCAIFAPIPESFDLVRQLKGRYKLGLLSNTSELHYECAIRPVEIFPLFDAVTLSFEVKAMKPSEKIYRDILTKLAVPPEACVYVDDIEENVLAARSLGFRATVYRSPGELRSFLHAEGVVF